MHCRHFFFVPKPSQIRVENDIAMIVKCFKELIYEKRISGCFFVNLRSVFISFFIGAF
jgi:hypothetical protein